MKISDIKPIKNYQDIHEGDIYCALDSNFRPCVGIVWDVHYGGASYERSCSYVTIRGDNIKNVLLLRPKGKGKLEVYAGEEVINKLKIRDFAVEAKEVMDKARVYLAHINKKHKKP